MRFEGTLSRWNDERGFGFLTPLKGGDDVFVHVKAFGPTTRRPEVGLVLSFEVETTFEGKKRAVRVEPVRPVRPAARAKARSHDRPAEWGTASKLAIPAFIGLYVALSIRWHVPWQFAAAYLVMSMVTLMAYAFDKSAAVEGRWRTSEAGLLLLGLVGGWPGAIVGQQLLRHKSSKREFRVVFWGTVLLNVGAFTVLNSPVLAALRA